MTFKWLLWHLWAAGSWCFLPAAMSQISICRLTRVPSLHTRVSTCLKSVCVFWSVCSYVSLCLVCVKKLGHDVCKGAWANYGPLCSLHALSYQPDTPSLLRWSADTALSVVHTAPAVCCVHYDLGASPTIFAAICFFVFCLYQVETGSMV